MFEQFKRWFLDFGAKIRAVQRHAATQMQRAVGRVLTHLSALRGSIGGEHPRNLEVNIQGSADYSNILVVGEVRQQGDTRKLTLILLMVSLVLLIGLSLVFQVQTLKAPMPSQEGELLAEQPARALRVGISSWVVRAEDQALDAAQQAYCSQIAHEMPSRIQDLVQQRLGRWSVVERFSRSGQAEAAEQDVSIFGGVECSPSGVGLSVQFQVNDALLAWTPELAEWIKGGALDDSVRLEQNADWGSAVDAVADRAFSSLSMLLALKVHADLSEGKYSADLQALQPVLQILDRGQAMPKSGLAAYVLGKLYSKAAFDQCGEVDERLLDQAFEHFERARQQMDWGAPVFEQGVIAYQRALSRTGSVHDVQSLAIESERLTSQALQQLSEPYRRLAQAQAYLIAAHNRLLIRSRSPYEAWGYTLDTAEVMVSSALALLESEAQQTPLLRELRAQAYLLKGNLLAARQLPQASREAYEQAYALATHLRTREQAGARLASSWVASRNPCEAAALYAELARSRCQAKAAVYARQAQLLAYQCRVQHDKSTP